MSGGVHLLFQAPGFNEAPARMPGKRSCARPTVGRSRPTFNEAPARMPGKSPSCGDGVRKVQRHASMRPRHECQGRVCPNCYCTTGQHSFNEAPARMPGKRSRPRVFVPRCPQASMRPRHECRGRAQSRLAVVHSVHRFNEAPARMPGKRGPHNRICDDCKNHASMRPRHECRGRGARTIAYATTARTTLQ